jgi:hypothetical protein
LGRDLTFGNVKVDLLGTERYGNAIAKSRLGHAEDAYVETDRRVDVADGQHKVVE